MQRHLRLLFAAGAGNVAFLFVFASVFLFFDLLKNKANARNDAGDGGENADDLANLFDAIHF